LHQKFKLKVVFEEEILFFSMPILFSQGLGKQSIFFMPSIGVAFDPFYVFKTLYFFLSIFVVRLFLEPAMSHKLLNRGVKHSSATLYYSAIIQLVFG